MKKNKLLLASWILGALYFVFLVTYFMGATSNGDGMEQAGAVIATAIVMPHMVAVGLATLFNILGWAQNRRSFALTGGILYSVSIVLFPIYFMFVIIQVILSFWGYSKLKKTEVKD